MADDRHYVPGDFYRICDRTGFKVRAGKTSQEWNGKIVRSKSWEPRNEQDFVRGVRDDQSVPLPRPRQVDQFLGPLTTTISVAAAAGATTLKLGSSVRMIIGDNIQVILDDGTTFNTFIQTVPDSVTVTILPKLPYKAAVGNVVADISAVASASIG